jgi:spore photoproduct lyase
VWLGGPKHDGKIAMSPDNICRPAWRLNTMYGCPHHCVYCYFGEIIPIYVNIGEFCSRLSGLIKANPWQKVFLYDDAAEALFPEPELGAVEDFVKCCQQFPDRYLVVHTKSANVDFLKSLDHKGRCIMTWSLTSNTQSRLTERLTGTMDERIEAAHKCVSWGFPVRFKFKPIVPFKNWREDAREMIRKAMTVKLDNVSLFTIAWMGVDELKACFPVERLDPGFLREAEQAKDEMKTRQVRPYPHRVRAEIYGFFIEEIRKHNPDIPITLCTEATDMWEEFAPLLDRKPGNFVCGCGPMTIPGLKRLPKNPWTTPKPVSVWAAS